MSNSSSLRCCTRCVISAVVEARVPSSTEIVVWSASRWPRSAVHAARRREASAVSSKVWWSAYRQTLRSSLRGCGCTS
jgi:hypothetical protein